MILASRTWAGGAVVEAWVTAIKVFAKAEGAGGSTF